MTDVQLLVVGKIVRPHGVRGDVRVEIMTSFPRRLRTAQDLYMDPAPTNPKTLKPLHVESARPDKPGYWVFRFEEVPDRDTAETVRNQYIYMPLADAEPLEDGEVYLFQVMGLNVITESGEALGKVVEIIETGANDVYVVRGEAYGEVLIPAIDSVINKIDIESGTMNVTLPEGLI